MQLSGLISKYLAQGALIINQHNSTIGTKIHKEYVSLIIGLYKNLKDIWLKLNLVE